MKRKSSLVAVESLKKEKVVQDIFPLQDLSNDMLSYVLQVYGWEDSESLALSSRDMLRRMCSSGLLSNLINYCKQVSRDRTLLGFRGPRWLRCAFPKDWITESAEEEEATSVDSFVLRPESVTARYEIMLAESMMNLKHNWAHEQWHISKLDDFAVAGGAVCREMYSRKHNWTGRWTLKDSDLDVWLHVPYDDISKEDHLAKSQYEMKDAWSLKSKVMRSALFRLLQVNPNMYKTFYEEDADALYRQYEVEEEDEATPDQQEIMKIGYDIWKEARESKARDQFSVNKYSAIDILTKVPPPSRTRVLEEMKTYRSVSFDSQTRKKAKGARKHIKELDLRAFTEQRLRRAQWHRWVYPRSYAAIETFDISLTAVSQHFTKDAKTHKWSARTYLTPQALHTFRTGEILVNCGDAADFTAYEEEERIFTPREVNKIQTILHKDTEVIRHLAYHLWKHTVIEEGAVENHSGDWDYYETEYRGKGAKHTPEIHNCPECLREMELAERPRIKWSIKETEPLKALSDTLKDSYQLKVNKKVKDIGFLNQYRVWFKRLHKYYLRFPEYSWHYFVAPLGMLNLALNDLTCLASTNWCGLRGQKNLFHVAPCICGQCSDFTPMGIAARQRVARKKEEYKTVYSKHLDEEKERSYY